VNALENQFSQSTEQRNYTMKRFADIHQQLRQNASERAAKALHDLLEKSR
jgi:lipid A disaccharide synthetase